MSDEEINLADPSKGAVIIAQWDGSALDTKTRQLHEHWKSEIDLTNSSWIWIRFSKPSWIMSTRIYIPSREKYPTIISAFYSTDEGDQIISLFQETKIMIGKDNDFIERGIAPVSSDNMLLIFSKFNPSDKLYLPKLKDIQIMGYYEE